MQDTTRITGQSGSRSFGTSRISARSPVNRSATKPHRAIGATVAALIAFAPISAGAITGVLCIKATGKGAVKVRNPTCKPTEVEVGSFDTATPHASLKPQDISVLVESPFFVPNSSFIAVPFDNFAEIYDTADLHDGGTNPQRLTAPVDGKYLVYGYITWNGSPAGTYRYAALLVDGNTAAGSSTPPIGASFQDQAVSTVVDLNAGSYVSLQVSQNSGASLNAAIVSLGMVKLP